MGQHVNKFKKLRLKKKKPTWYQLFNINLVLIWYNNLGSNFYILYFYNINNPNEKHIKILCRSEPSL